MRFFGKDHQSLHIYMYNVHAMRIPKMLISYIKLDHTLYSINYGNSLEMTTRFCALWEPLSLHVLLLLVTFLHKN